MKVLFFFCLIALAFCSDAPDAEPAPEEKPPAACPKACANREQDYEACRYYCPHTHKCYNTVEVEHYYFKCPVLQPYDCAHGTFGKSARAHARAKSGHCGRAASGGACPCKNC